MAVRDRQTQGLNEQLIWRDLYRDSEVYYPNHIVRSATTNTLWKALVKTKGYAPPDAPITTDRVWQLVAVVSGIDIVALINEELGGTGWQSGGSGGTNLAVANHTADSLDITSDTGADATIPQATPSLAGLLSATDKTKLDSIASGATVYDDERAQDAVGSILDDGTEGTIVFAYDDDAPLISATLKDGSVDNVKLADMVQATIKGRPSGAGTGAPQDLTPAEATAIMDTFVPDTGTGGTKGLVPAPVAGDADKYLKGSGAFDTPGDEVRAAASLVQRLRVVVALDDGKVRHMDPTDVDDAYRVLGVSLNAGDTDEQIFVRPYGRLRHPDFNFSPVGVPVYATTAGTLTTDPPTSMDAAFSLLVGYAIEANTLHVRMSRAVEFV